jgi:hypothetical protein
VEIEQRVKTLEYEMRILKNEINRTITEIQEHILAQYTAQAAQAAAAAKPPEAAPVLKPASLTEIHQVQGELADEEQQALLKRLEAWAKGNIERVGSGRVGRLVTLFDERGFLQNAERRLLVELVATHDDNGPIKAPLTQVLDMVLKLNELVGRTADGEEALQIIEEANLG